MAVLTTPLPADLPENWANNQIIAPSGASVGLSEQHGYNYQSEAINKAQLGVNAALGNIAEIETSPAGSAHSVGARLVYNGKLYKVTAPIVQGGTIVISGSGANVTPTTAEDDIAAQGSAAQSKIRQQNVTLSAPWSGAGPYTQTVTISGSTSNSKVDLQPTAAQLAQLINDGVQALYIANNSGTLTAYAVGAAPSTAMTLQCTLTEVTA